MQFDMVREVREDLEMTQQEVASMLGVSRPTYCMWETGRDNFPLRKLNMVSNRFGTSLDYLLGLTRVKTYNIIREELDLEVIGNNLYNIRKQLGLTQREIAESINTSQSTWWSYEKGRYLIITPFVYALAVKYNLSVDAILGKTK